MAKGKNPKRKVRVSKTIRHIQVDLSNEREAVKELLKDVAMRTILDLAARGELDKIRGHKS